MHCTCACRHGVCCSVFKGPIKLNPNPVSCYVKSEINMGHITQSSSSLDLNNELKSSLVRKTTSALYKHTLCVICE